ncbi:hypothetical protein HBA55_25240 [Pseudomaricurvus alkylphenolicus]|jgi:hypothetical protein|uniref:hypothetical protein n=1 Tax=Pseudomaricurvus alkylphenolicus TaxID=1306991 RepID=UPI0014230FE1|nr:hypothetical protein [Pseudomaricurvus alkylphenolicus]NIB42937.1 hypothetical protein [Pseudomaricurvus alkylphenolicus]
MSDWLLYHRKGLMITLAVLLIAVVNSLLTLAWLQRIAPPEQPVLSAQTSKADRAPLDSYQATSSCKQTARSKIGDTLLRTSTDWHSTRFEADRRFYLVALKADVGDLDVFEEAYIYCYIDPRDYAVTYFKAYDSKHKPLLSGFSFGDLIGALRLN